MTKKNLSLMTIIAGVILTTISLTADYIGIGSYPGINSAQLTGAAIGLLIILIGLLLRRGIGKEEQ